ncbi:MAG: hypothetical protein A3D92_11665 [Bacteroidetes bacterium RIFCSPHIGHO2_02_FULL_44_7]|nr:MAG: hypothetical protein A3D92_11665 [Bacteroidetes bacterium RIFCSPHIGHO2_02_FULL_44_7]
MHRQAQKAQHSYKKEIFQHQSNLQQIHQNQENSTNSRARESLVNFYTFEMPGWLLLFIHNVHIKK